MIHYRVGIKVYPKKTLTNRVGVLQCACIIWVYWGAQLTYTETFLRPNIKSIYAITIE